MREPVQALVFDNVRPSSLTLDKLLGGRVAVRLLGAADDLPGVVRELPALDGPEA